LANIKIITSHGIPKTLLHLCFPVSPRQIHQYLIYTIFFPRSFTLRFLFRNQFHMGVLATYSLLTSKSPSLSNPNPAVTEKQTNHSIRQQQIHLTSGTPPIARFPIFLPVFVSPLLNLWISALRIACPPHAYVPLLTRISPAIWHFPLALLKYLFKIKANRTYSSARVLFCHHTYLDPSVVSRAPAVPARYHSN